MTIAPISFEFFPPKTTEGVEKLRETRLQLAKFKPEFFSVTFGAGGSTRDRTMETVLEIQQEGFSAAPHISCVSSSKAEIRGLLQSYQAQGIKRLVTLRGDVPSGEVCVGDFRYALDLVEFIRAETGNHFHLEVAAYPEFHPEAKTRLIYLILSAKLMQEPTQRLRSIFIMLTLILDLWISVQRQGLMCQLCLVLCPFITLPS